MLDPFLVDAENAYIGGMMMAAGIDAARDVQPQPADFGTARRIRKLPENLLGKRQRAGIGQIALIELGAGDHVADQPFLGTVQPGVARGAV